MTPVEWSEHEQDGQAKGPAEAQAQPEAVRGQEPPGFAQGHEEAPLTEPYFPTVQDAQEIHDQAVLDHGQPHAALLDPGKLESAMGRAANYWHYGEGSPQERIADSAGALAHGIGAAQSFEDGNKRSAYHTARYFLHANDLEHLSPGDQDDDELADHLIGHGEGTHSLQDTQNLFRSRGGFGPVTSANRPYGDLTRETSVDQIPSAQELAKYRSDRNCTDVADAIEKRWPHLRFQMGQYARPGRDPYGHVWNVAPDGTIVDMTATQLANDYVDSGARPAEAWPPPSHPEVIPPNHRLHGRYQPSRPPGAAEASVTPPAREMYHVAPQTARDSIAKRGIHYEYNTGSPWEDEDDEENAYQPVANYVFHHLHDAQRYAQERDAPHDIWQVNASGLGLHPDPEGGSEIAASYAEEPISPDRLSLVDVTPPAVTSGRARRYYRLLPSEIREQVRAEGMVPNPITGNPMHFWDNLPAAQRYSEICNGIEPHDIWEVHPDAVGNLKPDPWFTETRHEWGDKPGAWRSDATHIAPEHLRQVDGTPPANGQYGNLRGANILDAVHDELDPTVWMDPNTDAPTLKPEHRHWLITTINAALAKHGYEGMEEWLSLVLTGSLTTYQYSEHSDVDVSLWVDAPKFPEWSRGEMIGIMVAEFDDVVMPGTTHPLQAFVVASKKLTKDELYHPGLRSGYDLETQRWISPPDKSRSHDVEHEQNGDYTYALEVCDKLSRLLMYESDKAIKYWDMIHKRRMRDQSAGKGDFAQSNVVLKMIENRGLADDLRALGVKIA